MIVPHDAQGRPVNLKLPVSWLYAAAGLALFSVILVGSSFVYSTLLSRKLVNYSDTLSRSQQQEVVINSFSDKTVKVGRAIEELVQKDNELRKLLGLKGWQSKVKLSTDRISAEVKAGKVSTVFEEAHDKLAERKQSLEELKQWVAEVRSRFASTPSTWPFYGRLVSYFGYRSYPWRGVHTGIDIQSYRGAPVRSTAAGVVSFIGWRNGYGKTVEVNHGYGVATLYAHNSGYAVKVGQRVRKGQVICYVGTTGWSTGPHVHYEVRRYDRPINPIAFLDMNILSASRFWR